MQKRTLAYSAIIAVLGCANAYSQATSRVDTIQYSDNLSTWVLSQVSQTTTNGVEATHTTYDPTTSLPTATYSFGLLKNATTYNTDGTVASVQDGNGNTTFFKNYMRGIPQEVDFPATQDQPSGTKITAVVDGLGQIDSIVDQKGAKTCYGYDAMGRINSIQVPSADPGASGQCDGLTTTITFAPIAQVLYGLPVGSWQRQSVTGNSVAQTFYDGLWRPVVEQTYDASNINGSISQVVTRYDVDGNVAFKSYPQSTVDTSITNTWGDPTQTPNATGTTTIYDALDRATSETQSAEPNVQVTTAISYQPSFQTQVIDPNKNVTTTSYLTYDEPTTDWPITIAAPAGVTQTIARDAFGSPTSITQAGSYNGTAMSLTKYFVYDAYHRVCRFYEPETNSTVYGYDNDSNIVWQATGQNISGGGTVCGQDQVAASAETHRTYDALNRVKTIMPPGGTQSTVYIYDATDNIRVASSGATVWSAMHNLRGEIIQESLQISGQNPWTIGYHYDAYANLNTVVYPNGESVGYGPDALGRATQVGSYASGVIYFPNGQVAGFNFGNNASYVAEQNARQLLSNFSYGAGSSLALSEDYSYDANANITNVNDLVSGKRTKSFSYDALNRLTGATASNLYGAESYTYDALNNLRTRITGGNTLTLNYDASNHLANVAQGAGVTTIYNYDVQGNRNSLSSGGTTTQYIFDAKNQLLQISGLESYAYDAAGRRVSKTPRSGVSTYYFYSQSGQLLYQWDAAAGNSTNFIYLGKKLIAKNVQPGGVNTGGTGVSVLFPPDYSTTGSYTISWDAISGASSYVLQSLVNGVWMTIYSGTANAYGISGAANGIYQYRVQACVNGNCGAWSATTYVTVNNQTSPAIPTLAPLLAVNRLATPLNYTVLWKGVDSASTYNLQQQFQGGAWAAVYSGPNGSWDATNKPVGSYSYQVQACTSTGCGPWSPAVSIKVSVDISPIISLLLDDN